MEEINRFSKYQVLLSNDPENYTIEDYKELIAMSDVFIQNFEKENFISRNDKTLKEVLSTLKIGHQKLRENLLIRAQELWAIKEGLMK